MINLNALNNSQFYVYFICLFIYFWKPYILSLCATETGIFLNLLTNFLVVVVVGILIMGIKGFSSKISYRMILKLTFLSYFHLWHDQGEWVGCRKYWFWATGLKEMTNSYGLLFFSTSQNICILATVCPIEMGLWLKCSVLSRQLICFEKSKLNIADMWLIPLDRVTFMWTWVWHKLVDNNRYTNKQIPNWPGTSGKSLSLNIKCALRIRYSTTVAWILISMKAAEVASSNSLDL